jgi:light-independent protochlorophyllide reductase subunit B
MTTIVPIGIGATRDFVREVATTARARCRRRGGGDRSRLPWYSRSVDSTYLTGKRVFIFGDGRTPSPRPGSPRKSWASPWSASARTAARWRARCAAAAAHGLEALITDDYLAVEAAIAEAARRSWSSAPRWSATSPSGSASRAP